VPSEEERFAPSAKVTDRVSIQDMLSGSRHKPAQQPALPPQLEDSGPATLAQALGRRAAVPSFAAGTAQSTLAGRQQVQEPSGSADGHVVFSMRKSSVPMAIRNAYPGTERAAGILSAKAFDYAANGGQASSQPGTGGTIAQMLSGASGHGPGHSSIKVSIPDRPDSSQMTAIDRRYEAKRMRGEAEDALKRASTLQQLRADAEAAKAAEEGLSGTAAGSAFMQPFSIPPRDDRGHMVFSKKKQDPSPLIKASAAGKARDASDDLPQLPHPKLAPVEPGRWTAAPAAAKPQFEQGPARFTRLFQSTSSRMRQPGRRRESLKEIYRRIESCQ
ncbi:MAG: hypothetical protein ACI4NA_03875, partial [Succinivibrio sp.]